MGDSTNTIDRSLSILEAAAQSEHGLSNSDISRRLKIPKSSASYILRVLERRGYLLRDTESGRYRLGLKLMSLTRDMLTHIDVREVAKPIMEQFVKATNLSAHLAVLDNGRAVYVEKVEAQGFVKMDIWVGHRLPVHSTSIGKVLVSGMADDEITGILNLRGMEQITNKTISTPQRFLKEIENVRKFGFAIDNEENSVGVRCVSAPVYDMQGKIVAALGTSSTIMQLNDENLSKTVELIRDCASQVSEKMGYSGQYRQR